jgi:hypothetical protein
MTRAHTRAGRSARRRSAAALACAAAVLVAGCGYNPLEGSRSQRFEERENALVLRYCAYGSESVPALESCVKRIEAKDVRSDRSNAGRYASGRLARCRDDAGPYCGRVGP